MKLIDNARHEFHRLWSIRVAVFFIALNCTMAAISALSGTIDPWVYFTVSIVGNTTLVVARLLKQPGAGEDNSKIEIKVEERP